VPQIKTEITPRKIVNKWRAEREGSDVNVSMPIVFLTLSLLDDGLLHDNNKNFFLEAYLPNYGTQLNVIEVLYRVMKFHFCHDCVQLKGIMLLLLPFALQTTTATATTITMNVKIQIQEPNENRQSKVATVVECDGQVFALLEEHWQLACCDCLCLSGCLTGWLAGWLAGWCSI
ncbi:hypothetical protein DOY81_000699, partial [Sarcophaga bullata]